MKELSQNPDYETMWKTECQLNKELQEQNKILREALEFYADRNNWEDDNIDPSDTEPRKEIFNGTTLYYYDGGKRAREALAKVGETFRAFKEHKKEKKRSNLECSIKILKEKNIDFCMLSPTHIRINLIYDFWPSTGLYICNKTNKRGRWIFNLLKEILKT